MAFERVRQAGENRAVMTTEARRAKLEKDLKLAETAFQDELIAELEECAAGRWGLFGQNGDAWDAGKTLETQGERIAELRQRLGYMEDYEPLLLFVEFRRNRGPNAMGEPKLAQQLLNLMRRAQRGSI